MKLKAPFPYFGAKSMAAEIILSRFGASALGNYAEPFFGSGAVWLNRPDAFTGWAILNDLNGHVANFWRAIKASPAEVARYAGDPVHECDLHARHLWLVTTGPALSARLMADPEHYDAKAAGWWAWGACSWIGGGWCAGDGPWHAEPDAEGVPTFTKGDGGTGVNRQLPHLGNGGTGVNRKLPHLGDGGKGVNRKQDDKAAHLSGWFGELSAAFTTARFACGDWQRICSPDTLTRNGLCAVLLDPPYSQTEAVYASDSNTVAHDVRAWCATNGANPKLRIALCGHAGEHEALEALGWTVETWTKKGGYSCKSDDRERIWFSPACLGTHREPELF